VASECGHGVDYNRVYDIWHADKNTKLYKNEMLRYFHLLNLLPKNISTVIDIGCGTGYMASLMANRKLKITAVDISENSLACFSGITQNLNIKQIHQDFYKLNLNNFDLLLSQEVLEHIEDYEKALKKMASFIKLNGYGIFCVPFEENLEAKTKRCISCGHLYHTSGHLHSFTKDKLANALSNTGFTMLKLDIIVNKRTFKWLAKTKISVNKLVLQLDKMLNVLFSHKAAYMAALCQKN
jgi:2-polyprenyl-3-methyl-5-hydroxy-6-metoxy-1,4-benzoquinol methylase